MSVDLEALKRLDAARQLANPDWQAREQARNELQSQLMRDTRLILTELERIPELERELRETASSYHTVCVQVAAFEEAAEKVASAPRAGRDVAISVLRRVLEGYVGTRISVEEDELERLRRVEAALRAIVALYDGGHDCMPTQAVLVQARHALVDAPKGAERAIDDITERAIGRFVQERRRAGWEVLLERGDVTERMRLPAEASTVTPASGEEGQR